MNGGFMNNLERIVRALDFIENNLKEPLDLTTIAYEAAFSAYHFHRIFNAAAGESIMSYVRKRRLTEAALELVGSERKIIDIAFDYQFETPESFSRAFKRQFGMVPSRFRIHGVHASFCFKKTITDVFLRHLKGGVSMKPVIIKRDTINVIGVSCKGKIKNDAVPGLWEQFGRKLPEITNIKEEQAYYGVCSFSDDFEQTGTFEYITGVAVTDLSCVPKEMVGKEIGPATYAVFTHKGPVESLNQTYDYIYGIWAAKSEYRIAKNYDFALYDRRYTPDAPETSEVDIYIPIER